MISPKWSALGLAHRGRSGTGRFPALPVLDHLGSTELAAYLFRATQTEEKLRREHVRQKETANRIHHEVGGKVRLTIHELGRTMPENLPVAVKGYRFVKGAVR